MKISGTIKLLMLSLGFTVLLIVFRFFYYESWMYIFFIWNLFLAGIPFLLSTMLMQVKKKHAQWILFIVWLLFFPNALYIITDLMHLKERQPIPFWFDVILVFSAAFNGIIIAFASLYQIEIFLSSKFNYAKTNSILFSCLFLSSFGIYLGRYLRWNSWDILFKPFAFLKEIVQRFINPMEHPRTWGMTIILTLFFAIFYFIIKKLPKAIMNH